MKIFPLLTSCVLVSALVWQAPARSAAILGFVSDDGEPVTKAEVMLVNAGNDVSLNNADTDSDGAFRFAVKPGIFNIATFKQDYATVWTKGVIVRNTDISVRIELTPAAFKEGASTFSESDCD